MVQLGLVVLCLQAAIAAGQQPPSDSVTKLVSKAVRRLSTEVEASLSKRIEQGAIDSTLRRMAQGLDEQADSMDLWAQASEAKTRRLRNQFSHGHRESLAKAQDLRHSLAEAKVLLASETEGTAEALARLMAEQKRLRAALHNLAPRSPATAGPASNSVAKARLSGEGQGHGSLHSEDHSPNVSTSIVRDKQRDRRALSPRLQKWLDGTADAAGRLSPSQPMSAATGKVEDSDLLQADDMLARSLTDWHFQHGPQSAGAQASHASEHAPETSPHLLRAANLMRVLRSNFGYQ